MKSLGRALELVDKIQIQHSRVEKGGPCAECAKRHPCPTFFIMEKLKAELQAVQKEQGVQ